MIPVKTETVNDELFVSRNDLLQEVRNAKIVMYKKAQGVFNSEARGALMSLTIVEQVLLDLQAEVKV